MQEKNRDLFEINYYNHECSSYIFQEAPSGAVREKVVARLFGIWCDGASKGSPRKGGMDGVAR